MKNSKSRRKKRAQSGDVEEVLRLMRAKGIFLPSEHGTKAHAAKCGETLNRTKSGCIRQSAAPREQRQFLWTSLHRNAKDISEYQSDVGAFNGICAARRCSDENDTLPAYLPSLKACADLFQGGNIYVIGSASWGADVYKIGMTKDNPETRARTLSTGIPGGCYVAFRQTVSDCALAEQLIHERLRPRRTHQRQEFFAVSLSEAIEIIIATCAKVDESALE